MLPCHGSTHKFLLFSEKETWEMSGKRESLCWGFHTGMESDMVTRKTVLIWSLQGEVKQMTKLRIPYGHLKASKTFMTIYYKVIYYTVSRGKYKQGHLLHSHREIHTRPSTTLSSGCCTQGQLLSSGHSTFKVTTTLPFLAVGPIFIVIF